MAKQSEGYVFEENGKWIARITFTDSNGKRRNLRASCPTKTEAKDALIRLRQKIKDGEGTTHLAGKAESLDRFLDRWLEDAAKPKLKVNTLASYQWLLASYIRPTLGGKRLSNLTPTIIQHSYTEMLKRGLSATTVRLTHAVLHSALKQAVHWGLLAQNPADRVVLPKQQKKELTALTPEQASSFIQAAQEDRYGALFLTAIETGLRPAELLGLQWSDLDFDRLTLAVRRTLVRPTDGSKGWIFDSPKTAKSSRTLTISRHLADTLKAHKRAQNETRLKAGAKWNHHDLVFTAELGQPLTQRNLAARHFKPLLEKAGLPADIRPYDLRHACATLSLAAGENLKIVSERLGHASIQLTADVYSHVSEGMQRAATDRLAAMLYGKAEDTARAK